MELYTGSPGYSLTKNFTSGAPNYMYMTGGTAGLSGYAHAPVHLPHGAVVTDLQMTVYDNDGSVTGEVGLYRVSNGSSGVMATCQSNDVAGIVTYNDPTVSNATIDNSNYSYGLRIIGNQNGGTNLRFYNVVITYTVTKAD